MEEISNENTINKTMHNAEFNLIKGKNSSLSIKYICVIICAGVSLTKDKLVKNIVN